jgi:hypothetical protein
MRPEGSADFYRRITVRTLPAGTQEPLYVR